MPNELNEWIIKFKDAWRNGPIETDPSPKTANTLNNINDWEIDWYDERMIIKDVTAKPGLKPRRDL